MKIPAFKNDELFKKAFTHRSYLNEAEVVPESNERLEFMGDSILSFVVSSYIYNTYPSLKEGELTNLRSALTNTQTLYSLAKDLDLGQHLLLSHGEESGGGRLNKSILANTVEAVIGALFLDQGIGAVETFIAEILLDRIDEVVKVQGLKDAKSMLQEKVQEKHKTSPIYKIITEEGPDHAKTYTIGVYLNTKLLAEGVGHSKQEGEKAAAAKALQNLE